MFSKQNCPIQEQVKTNSFLNILHTPHSTPNTYLIHFQISNANDTIQELMQRIELLESNLKSPNLSDDKRKVMEHEINEIKKLLNTNKDLLGDLHKENSKSFALTASLVFACFLVYGVYVMIYGA